MFESTKFENLSVCSNNSYSENFQYNYKLIIYQKFLIIPEMINVEQKFSINSLNVFPLKLKVIVDRNTIELL